MTGLTDCSSNTHLHVLRIFVKNQEWITPAAISSPCGTMNIIKTTAGCISRAGVYMLNIPPGGAFDLTVTIVYMYMYFILSSIKAWVILPFNCIETDFYLRNLYNSKLLTEIIRLYTCIYVAKVQVHVLYLLQTKLNVMMNLFFRNFFLAYSTTQVNNDFCSYNWRM